VNYLGHAWLSFGNPDVLVGNMISDFVKGRARDAFPAAIQVGISLHRQIDAYTDAHPASRAAQDLFRSDYRLYSAPIVDVVWDHFLANDAEAFPPGRLAVFASEVYSALEQRPQFLPQRFAGMLPYMKEQNWLLNYRERWGTRRSLQGLERRARYLGSTDRAFALFEARYQHLQDWWQELAGAVKEFAKLEYGRLLNT